MACSGSSAATRSTKSPLPSSTASAQIFSARAFSSSCRALTARGVNARATIWRSLVWSGASWLMSRNPVCSRSSLVISGAKRMITPLAAAEKSVLFLETAATSAWVLIAQ